MLSLIIGALPLHDGYRHETALPIPIQFSLQAHVALRNGRCHKSWLQDLTGRMAGKLLSSFSWWLPPRRRSIMHGCTALDGTQDSPSELLGTRVTPLCPLLHASLQCAGRVMAGVQLWSKVAQAMRCCRLPLPELAYFDYWCEIRAQIKARRESVARFRSRLASVRTAVWHGYHTADAVLAQYCARLRSASWNFGLEYKLYG